MGEEWILRVTAPPVDGAANRAILSLVGETLKVPLSAVSLVSGQHSTHKRLKIDGLSQDDVDRLLAANVP